MDETDQDACEDHLITITFKIAIEDVTKKTAQEFVKRLTDPGEGIEFQLRDGLYYEAVVDSVDYVGFVE